MHGLCFLVVREETLQAGDEREVPNSFSRSFLPFLLLINVPQWKFGLVCVLVIIHDAVDAGVLFFVW
jgi:hypothetical protein